MAEKKQETKEAADVAGEEIVMRERERMIADVLKRLKGKTVLVRGKDGQAAPVAISAEHILDVKVRGGKVVAVTCDGRKLEVGDA